MEQLIPPIKRWFAAKDEHLAVFSDSDSRVEGWFKGELLVLFTRLRQAGVITEFKREASVPCIASSKRIQVDLRLQIGTEIHLCELKALCISQAAGTPRNLNFYFRDDHVGIVKDFRKLEGVVAAHKWLIAFVYPAPDPMAWERAIGSLPSSVQMWKSLNSPTNSAGRLFVSLWRFEGVSV